MNLEPIPTMIEASNLDQLNELKNMYQTNKENGEITFDTAFMVLRSKENDFLAYFHDASKNPTIKETVEWMQDTDNLTFPGNVSLQAGITQRYDEKFHNELKTVIPEVFDAWLARMDKLGEIMEKNPNLISQLEEFVKDLPPIPKSSVKIK
jgi:hypothetical protein